MNNKVILTIYAITPFVIGNIVNLLIASFGWYGFSILAISLCFCVYWIVLGYKSVKYSKSLLEATLIGNSFALICCGALIFSAIMFGGYMSSILGLQAQMFFLPMTRLTAIILGLTGYISTNGVIIASLIIMIILYVSGYELNVRQRK